MSDSDDTDLLLLIPPDFFLVHTSDSEDSVTSPRRNHKHSRVDELISQVNDLKERVNFIESKDNLNSEKSLSDSSRFNQSLDYSLSLDSSNYNTVRQDLALRFYSMSSSGFRFDGRNNDGLDVQSTGSHVPSLSARSDYNPVIPISPSRANTASEFDPLKSHTSNAPSARYSIQVQPVEMSYSRNPSQIQFMTNEDLGVHSRISQQPQWKDCSFLSEIDEFLETGSRQSEDDEITGNKPQSEDETSAEQTSEPLQYENNIDLSVDTLLQQMEATHLEIERKVQTRDYKATEQSSRRHPEEFIDQYANRKLPLSRENGNDNMSKQVQELNGNTEPDNALNLDRRDTPGTSGYTAPQTLPSVEGSVSHYISPYQNLDSSKNVLSQNIATLLDRPNRADTQEAEREYNVGYENKASSHFLSSGFSGDWLKRVQRTLSQANQLLPAASGDISRSNDCAENYSQSQSREKTEREDIQSTDSVSSATGYPQSREMIHSTANLKRQSDCVHPVNDVVSSVYNMREKEKNTMRSQSRLNSAQTSKQSFASNSNSGMKELQVNVSTHGAPINKNNAKTHQEQIQASCSRSDLHSKKKSDFTSLASEKIWDILNNPPVYVPIVDDGYHSSGAGTSGTNLLSLSELWGSQSKIPQRENMTHEQKFEEEKLRRKHCEYLIQKLQSKLLEEQQKLAVAIRVDQAKDQVINQLQSAWKQLAVHWQELEEQRNSLSIQLSDERKRHQQDFAEVSKKVKHYEGELSKILDLAKGYKEKSDITEQMMKEMEEKHAAKLQEMEDKMSESEKCLMEAGRDVGDMHREMESMNEKVMATEAKLKERQNAVLKAQQETRKVKRDLEKMEADMDTLKKENSSSQVQLKEEKSKNSMLFQQKKDIQAALEESRKKEKLIREEVKEKINLVEKAKEDLRDYYQHQVNQVVHDKLAEFQTQLEQAESSLIQEADQREKAALETATRQIQHLTEKNQLEVKLLEEKHREELQLYKLQLNKATQQIGQMQERLQTYSSRKVEIVEKLHSVMETQWQEALRIISGNSPIVHPNEDQIMHQHANEKSETNVNQSNVYNCPNNSEQVSIENGKEENGSGSSKSEFTFHPLKPHENSFSASSVSPVKNNLQGGEGVPAVPIQQGSGGSSTADEMPFGREGQLTYRASQETENSVYTREGEEQLPYQTNHEPECTAENRSPEKDRFRLQKYIEMLLNRQPGDPLGGDTPEDKQSVDGDTPVKWENIMLQNYRQLNFSCTSAEAAKSSNSGSKDPRLGKPPWK